MQDLIDKILSGIQENSFVRLTLSAQRKKDELKKVIVKLILIKGREKLHFIHRYSTRDKAENLDIDDGIAAIISLLTEGFHVATLFTTANDFVYEEYSGKKKFRALPPSFPSTPERTHDKAKKRFLSQYSSNYLHLLGLADQDGRICASAQDKYKQINQYISLLSKQLERFTDHDIIRVADMGSGKGYLTFALYDFLSNTLNLKVTMKGVELREELVTLCNDVSQKTGFSGLSFEKCKIADYELKNIDVLVALHACDIATDEAIYKGIEGGAAMIVVAPCCHKQIRMEMEKHNVLSDIEFMTRFGIFLERQAEMITDGIRALILEHFGYQVKIVEFIADAHTHKNVMIIAQKKSKFSEPKTEVFRNKIADIKAKFGIEFHELEKLTGLYS